MEAEFNYDIQDPGAKILENEHIVKIRKLNKKIADNLKLLYSTDARYSGRLIGEEYGSHMWSHIISITLYPV